VNGWTVALTPAARRDLRLLEGGPQQAATEIIQDLAEDPELVPAVELRGNPNVRRTRFHTNYRLIYQVSKAEKRIIVTRIKLRNTAYKGMKR
jgi:mRNA-degrading endonuclease RelE of RelBE toxin-antitoxin system